MKYYIDIRGCDDSTRFFCELTDQELEGVLKIARESKEVSTYGCMPDISVYRICDKTDCKRDNFYDTKEEQCENCVYRYDLRIE